MYVNICISMYVCTQIYIFICCLAALTPASDQCLGDSLSKPNINHCILFFNSCYNPKITRSLVTGLGL